MGLVSGIIKDNTEGRLRFLVAGAPFDRPDFARRGLKACLQRTTILQC